MSTPDLNKLAARVHEANKKWWIDLETGKRIERHIGELEMLVISELSEALEGHRKNLPDDKLPHRKMVEVELADALIRELDIMGGFGWYVASFSYFSWGPNFADNLRRIVKTICADAIYAEDTHSYAIAQIVNLSERYGYDLWGAFEEKMEYNAKREDHTLEHRRSEHGKKY